MGPLDRMHEIEAELTGCAGPMLRIGGILLIQGDAREVLPWLEGQADLLLTDWPYRISSGGNTTGQLSGIFERGRYDNRGEFFPVVEWAEGAPLVFAACAENADCIVMTTDRESVAARVALEEAGFRFHRLLIWDKGTVMPNRWFMQPCEFAWYTYKGRARPITSKGSKALARVPHRDETQHPTEKPVGLMRHWIEQCSDPGALVLDPFMGTGTTLVAAAQAGRCAVGIEQDAEWFRVACERVRRAHEAGRARDLFSAPENAAEGAE